VDGVEDPVAFVFVWWDADDFEGDEGEDAAEDVEFLELGDEKALLDVKVDVENGVEVKEEGDGLAEESVVDI